MVDTGAMQSTFTTSQADLDRGPSKDAPSLVAANWSPIRCYGTRVLRISIMGRSYSWPFTIVDVSRLLLGADFLAHHGLLVDVAGRRLIDTGTCRFRSLRAAPATMSVSAVMTQPYTDHLQKFPDVFKPKLRQSPGSTSKHGIYHHITTTGPPAHAKFHRLPPQKLSDAKRAFEDMERMGPDECVAWRETLHLDGPSQVLLPGPRIPREHSEDCHCDTVWILHPRILNLQSMQCGGDLLMPNGYHPGLPTNLRLLRRQHPDILKDQRGTPEARYAILKRLQEKGLVVRFDKCTFGAEGENFLGHRVSSSGVKPLTT
ncbi:uncharacterized protein [Palaemon carinicauda]|uniref:uncharacterized protein n=1 Tax=Palaemon carinicauda TaxID=392227 RepID=UPI0035B679BA